jgi:hypothetical protein
MKLPNHKPLPGSRQGFFAKFGGANDGETYRSQAVAAGAVHVRRKGFRRIYGTAREGLEGFWARFGGVPIKDRTTVTVSGFNYTEMLVDLEPLPNAVTIDSGGYVILRPEGDWDRPGILEVSATRPVRDPLCGLAVYRNET